MGLILDFLNNSSAAENGASKVGQPDFNLKLMNFLIKSMKIQKKLKGLTFLRIPI